MSGELRAKIGFKKGLRTTLLEEYAKSGRRVTGYPDIVVNIRDEYKTAGRYRINMARSDTSTRVEFYRGEFINGCFDTTRCTPIKTVNGVGTLILKKSKTEGAGYVGIIGAMITSFGNRYLTAKRIDLPYQDLN